MYNPNLKLTELFKQNSLRNLTTPKQCPMPHKGNTYYLWVNNYSGNDSQIVDILEHGNSWSSVRSINSYIDLTDQAGELISNRLIQYGPQSNSSSFTIEITLNAENNIRMIAQGWGSSSIELYDGPSGYFLQYLLENQKRGL